MSYDPQHPWPPPDDHGRPVPAEPPPGVRVEPALAATGALEGAGDAPAWSAGQAIAAFVAALVATAILGAIVIGVGAELLGASTDDLPPGLTMLGVLVQDAILVATAVAFAGMTRRPRPRDFGLRRVRLWPAVGFSLIGVIGFVGLNAIYTAVFDPQGRQTVAEDLGVNDSTAALIGGAFVIIVLAPIAEEFFFRGFFYRGLRNTLARRTGRTAGVLLAALIDGVVFGAIHYTGRETLEIIPVLAMLGFVFCLVYERTGSLFTVIALHALVNTAAYTQVADEGVAVALAFGGVMLVGSVLVPRFLRAQPDPAPA